MIWFHQWKFREEGMGFLLDVKFFLSVILLGFRVLRIEKKKREKGFLPSSSSSSFFLNLLHLWVSKRNKKIYINNQEAIFIRKLASRIDQGASNQITGLVWILVKVGCLCSFKKFRRYLWLSIWWSSTHVKIWKSDLSFISFIFFIIRFSRSNVSYS